METLMVGLSVIGIISCLVLFGKICEKYTRPTDLK